MTEVSTSPSGSWLSHVWRGALTLMASAIALRVAWELVKPLATPACVGLVVLGAVWVYRRRHQW